MTVVLLKFVHVIAISLWSGGLLSLPFLFVQRRTQSGTVLYRLHNFTRFFYISLVSPAAFVAVASGIVLIFMRATFEPWFSVKLLLVAALVLIHVTSGLVILRLFNPQQAYARWRFIVATARRSSRRWPASETSICCSPSKRRWTSPPRARGP